MKVRSAAVVPDVSGTSLPRRELGGIRNEAWCRAMLVLFHPWRTFDDLKDNAHSWLKVYDETPFSAFHSKIMDNMEVMSDSKEARDSDLRSKHRRT
ncbi:hypothetical protein CALCODRAFT_437013, partial [Calocera cornea HHB12733]